jgi:5-(carboxyamino)imidazole ribonucleotide mutase
VEHAFQPIGVRRFRKPAIQRRFDLREIIPRLHTQFFFHFFSISRFTHLSKFLKSAILLTDLQERPIVQERIFIILKAAIIFGSVSDRDVMKKAAEIFREAGVEYSAHVLSAHRVPELLTATIRKLEESGVEVIIAGAGLSAALPGVIASQTTIPVIGVPIVSGGLGGLDALLSIVQMPNPIPVATVGINNARNAANLALEILAVKYPELKAKLVESRQGMKDGFTKNNSLKEDGGIEL